MPHSFFMPLRGNPGVWALVSLLYGRKSDIDPWNCILICADDTAAYSDMYKIPQSPLICLWEERLVSWTVLYHTLLETSLSVEAQALVASGVFYWLFPLCVAALVEWSIYTIYKIIRYVNSFYVLQFRVVETTWLTQTAVNNQATSHFT